MSLIWDNLEQPEGEAAPYRSRFSRNCNLGDKHPEHDPCFARYTGAEQRRTPCRGSADNDDNTYKHISFISNQATQTIFHNTDGHLWTKSSEIGAQILLYIRNTEMGSTQNHLRSYLRSFYLLRNEYDVPVIPLLIGAPQHTNTISMKWISSSTGELLRLKNWEQLGRLDADERAMKFMKKLARQICKLRPKHN